MNVIIDIMNVVNEYEQWMLYVWFPITSLIYPHYDNNTNLLSRWNLILTLTTPINNTIAAALFCSYLCSLALKMEIMQGQFSNEFIPNCTKTKQLTKDYLQRYQGKHNRCFRLLILLKGFHYFMLVQLTLSCLPKCVSFFY